MSEIETALTRLASYPSIYAIGHSAIAGLFDTPVLVEEKVDGSQFSFARVNGELVCRSKGAVLIASAPEKMFQAGVTEVEGLDLHDGWIYRAEYLKSPKHNTLAYSRTPSHNVILFDVTTGVETYLSRAEKEAEAKRLGLECVPCLFEGKVESVEQFKAFLERESILGGCQIEGVVVKNYALYTKEKKIALGKFVSEEFKEKHTSDWKGRNPGQADLVEILISQYRSEARWRKGIQHLRDEGKLEGSPRDIGLLMKEIPQDVFQDSSDEIMDQLFKHFWPQIQRGITKGLPEFYKSELAATAFKPKEEPQQ